METANPIVSDSNELSWYTTKKPGGFVKVDTDRTQSLIGFFKDGHPYCSNLAVGIKNAFAAITLSSMDSKPINRSGKMLLTTGSKVENTGMRWNAGRTRMTDIGGSPSLIEPVSGHIVLSKLKGAKSVTAYPMDGSGHPIGAGIQAEKAQDSWLLTVGDPITTWYVITVKR